MVTTVPQGDKRKVERKTKYNFRNKTTTEDEKQAQDKSLVLDKNTMKIRKKLDDSFRVLQDTGRGGESLVSS